MMKKVLFTTLAFMATSAFASPYVLMKETADALFSQIRNEQVKIAENPNHLRKIVRENLMPHIHVKYAGQLVLGKNLSTVSEEQKKSFFQAFDKFIEQSYAQALTLYKGQKVQIENEKPVEGKSLVSIRVNIEQGNQPVKLDFKWRKNTRTGDWQIYDMAAEGVSMVATKQNEWSGILRQKGIDALTKQVLSSSQEPILFK